MKRLYIILLALSCTLPAYSHTLIDGIHISGGKGKPAGLKGARLGFLKHWSKHWWKDKPISVTGYWDISMGHWRADPNSTGEHDNLTIVAFAPVFRFIPRWQAPKLQPYLDVSVGLSALSERHLGKRHFGWYLAFQDLVKVGLRFGSKLQFDVGYHFIYHYSNADIFPPNHGITVKEHNLSLNYWFN